VSIYKIDVNKLWIERLNLTMMSQSFFLGGNIRSIPLDFIVEEVWPQQTYSIRYSPFNKLQDLITRKWRGEKEYLHFTLVKTDWDTMRALRRIGKALHVSIKRFGIAGMKDKKAVSAQRVSMWHGRADQISQLRLKDLIIKDLLYAPDRITLGMAKGNRFTITIRGVEKTRQECRQILQQFQAQVMQPGIPNYYGPQRLSGGNAEVGSALKEGRLQDAVERILRKVQPYLQTGSVQEIPKVFWYEKRMVLHLKQFPKDYAGALRRIPKKIRRIFTHAYQSHLFNEQLKQLISGKQIPKMITIPGFPVPKMPELSTRPITRRSLLTADDFTIVHNQEGEVVVRFMLQKGEYASTLLSHLIYQ
jgi:tRNA pseudouridine13 synthase